jgi:hypothetical protein
MFTGMRNDTMPTDEKYDIVEMNKHFQNLKHGVN